MRRLEQKTQALKERAWQLKARVADAQGADARRWRRRAGDDRARRPDGRSFRLIKLDLLARRHAGVRAHRRDAARRCYKTKSFDVFTGPISPGNHNLQVARDVSRSRLRRVRVPLEVHVHRAAAAQTFTTGEGKISKVECKRLREGRRERRRWRSAPRSSARSPRSRRRRRAEAPTTATAAGNDADPRTDADSQHGEVICALPRLLRGAGAVCARSTRLRRQFRRPEADRRTSSKKHALRTNLPRAEELSAQARAAPAGSMPSSRTRSATTTRRR